MTNFPMWIISECIHNPLFIVCYNVRMKRFIRNNSLVLALLALFFMSLVGLSFSGLSQYNDEQKSHNQSEITYVNYLITPHFFEAVFENWESEYLQMWALVILTIYLKQKGASDSKKIRGKEGVDTPSRYSVIRSFELSKNRNKAIINLIYSNSLGIALLALFIFSFVLHGISGVGIYNEEAQVHGQEKLTLLGYFLSSQFWFESFQNWQSEFLAVASLLILSIFLRQRGSPESKPIGAPNSKTGE